MNFNKPSSNVGKQLDSILRQIEKKTGGNREFVPAMALAAKAFGANGYFFETHPDPEKAMSDGPNMLYLKDLETVIASLL